MKIKQIIFFGIFAILIFKTSALYAGKFEEYFADHFHPINEINSVVVSLSFDKKLFSWLDQDKLTSIAIETVKSQLPPELKNRVVEANQVKIYKGINLHLDFYVLSSPLREYPYAQENYIALATISLISNETIEGKGPLTPERRLGNLIPIKKEKNFDNKKVTDQINGLVKEYLRRLNECLDKKGYKNCQLNDLGYFDIYLMNTVNMYGDWNWKD